MTNICPPEVLDHWRPCGIMVDEDNGSDIKKMLSHFAADDITRFLI